MSRAGGTGRERWATAGLLAAMLAVAAVAWWSQLRPDLRVDAGALAALPLRLGDWRGAPVPLRTAVEQMLSADANLQRVYSRPDTRDLVWVYVGYYGTHRGGFPEHTPFECYPASGWRIGAHEEVVLDAERGLRANELQVSRAGERRLVWFWYRSARRSGMLGNAAAAVDRLRGRLSQGRADGALVRVSTPLEEAGAAEARARLRAFARAFDAQLSRHWPVETPPGEASAAQAPGLAQATFGNEPRTGRSTSPSS